MEGEKGRRKRRRRRSRYLLSGQSLLQLAEFIHKGVDSTLEGNR